MRYAIYIMMVLFFTGCYSFKGISVDYATTKTFSITTFDNNTRNIVPTLAQDLTEALREKILNDTRLTSTTANGDVQFSGEIVRYDITNVAPKAGETITANRLTIGVRIEYENLIDEKQNFTQTFEQFQDFNTSENLNDIQDGLIANINTELVELIVNAAFSNW